MRGTVKKLELYVPRASFIIIKTNDINKFMRECFVKEYPEFHVPHHSVNAVVCQSYSHYGPTHWMVFHKNPQPSTIAHESLHVVDYLCEAYNINDGEFRAYLIGYLVGEISKRCK